MFSYSNPRRRRLYKRETRFSKARTVVVLLFCSLVWPRLDMDILEMFFKIIISAFHYFVMENTSSNILASTWHTNIRAPNCKHPSPSHRPSMKIPQMKKITKTCTGK